MRKINNRGFTLVEMLAVVVILGVLAAIMVPSATAIIANSRNDNFENLKKSVKSAVKLYISDNRYDIQLSGTCSSTNTARNISKIGGVSVSSNKVTFQMLVSGNYLTTNSDGRIINPKNDKAINLNNSYVTVKYDCSLKDYTYGEVVIN